MFNQGFGGQGGFNGGFGGNGNGNGHGHGHGNHGQNQGFMIPNQGFINPNQGFNNMNQGFNNMNQGFNNMNQGFQQMGWHPTPGQRYKIVSALSPTMVLDVSQNPMDFNNLIIFTYGHTPNQKFYFQSAGNGKWGIFSVKTNQTVQVPNGHQGNGSRIVCSQPNKQPNEFWQLVPANFNGKKNAFYIKSFCGKALDVKQGLSYNQTHVIQWDYNGNNNQIWIIQPV